MFLAVFAIGLALRLVAMAGFPSILWFGGDSGTYLEAALNLKPSLIRPSGYSVFLWAWRPFHSLALVAAVQHLLGLASGVMIYALLRRRTRLPGWAAALAAAPVLLDGYQIELEHLLMADELFTFLALTALTVILWSPPTWRTSLIAGALLALAALTRSVGLPLLILLLLYLAVRRVGWRPLLSAALAFAVPMLAYMFWFKAEHRTFELTRTDSIWLYGRTVDFADCAKLKPPPSLVRLCPKPRQAGISASNQAMWGADSGLRSYPGGIGGVAANQKAAEFAWLAIRSQPHDYAGVVLRDTFRAFLWGHEPYPTAQTLEQYRFPVHPRTLIPVDQHHGHRYDPATVAQRTVAPFAGWMRAYQTWAYLPGPLLAAIMLLGLYGLVANRRDWGGPGALPWLFAVTLLVVPAATADFDYRYVLPVVPFACLAAGLSLQRPQLSSGKSRSTTRAAALPSSSEQNRSQKAS